MARSRTTYFALVLSALAVATLAPAGCGSDEDDDASGGSGASGSSDNTGATGATGGSGNGASGATGGTGTGGGDANVDCPEPGTRDACQQCAQDNCADEVTACCDQDADASAMGKKGCYDVVDCARETGCSDATTCIQVCGDDISGAGLDVATMYAQPLGDCVVAAVNDGKCPDCVPPGGAGGAGGGS